MGCIIQNHRLLQIPPEDAEIFDVVAKNTGTVVLIQPVSTREITSETHIYRPHCMARAEC